MQSASWAQQRSATLGSALQTEACHFPNEVLAIVRGYSLEVQHRPLPVVRRTSLSTVALSSNGLIATVFNRTVSVWQLATGAEVWSAPCDDFVSGLAISRDGSRVCYCGGKDARLWTIDHSAARVTARAAEQRLTIFSQPSFLPSDPATIVAICNQALVLIDVSTDTLRTLVAAPNRIVAPLAFTADGSRLLVQTQHCFVLISMESGQTISSVPGDTLFDTPSLSPDGSRMALGYLEGCKIVAKGANTTEFTERCSVRKEAASCGCFSPDGSVLAVGTSTSLELHRATDGSLLTVSSLPEGVNNVTALAFDSTGTSLVAISVLPFVQVLVWDVWSMTLAARLPPPLAPLSRRQLSEQLEQEHAEAAAAKVVAPAPAAAAAAGAAGAARAGAGVRAAAPSSPSDSAAVEASSGAVSFASLKRSYLAAADDTERAAVLDKALTALDAASASCYTAAYRYQDELRVTFQSAGLQSGFIQRAEPARDDCLFALVLLDRTTLSAEEVKRADDGELSNDESHTPHELHGAFVFRGLRIPDKLKEVDDTDNYDWQRIDTRSAAARAKFVALFTGATVDQHLVLNRSFAAPAPLVPAAGADAVLCGAQCVQVSMSQQ